MPSCKRGPKERRRRVIKRQSKMAAAKPTTSNSIVSKIDFVDDQSAKVLHDLKLYSSVLEISQYIKIQFCERWANQSADVLLTLVPLTSGKAIGPLKLHSSVLQQAEYFKIQLSERWALPTKRAEIELKICKDEGIYIRFFQLLYMPKEVRFFLNLEEALDILEIAEQLLWEDCRNSCMDYVERLPWTSEEEEVIRPCFSSSNRTLPADLSLRLSHAWDLSRDSVKAMIHASLDLVHWSIASLILQNLQAAPFAYDAHLQKLQIQIRNWDNLSVPDTFLISDIKALRWYIYMFRKLNMASTAFKVFAEDPSRFISIFCQGEGIDLSDFVNDLDLFFRYLCNEAVRKAMVTTRFPVFVKRLAKAPSFAGIVEDALLQKLQIQFRNWDMNVTDYHANTMLIRIIKELRWYIDTFRKLNIASTAAFKVFAEAPSPLISNFRPERIGAIDFSDFVNDLDLFFGNLCNEKVVVSQAVRAAVVTKWFPVFVTRLAKEDIPNRDWLERTVESLPFSDQCTIFNEWIKGGFFDWGASESYRLAEPFAIWCHKLNHL